MLAVIAGFVFAMVLCLTIAIVRATTRRDQMVNRMEYFLNISKERTKSSFSIRGIYRNIITRISGLFAARAYTEKIQIELLAAGIPLKGEEYLSLCASLVIVLPLVIYLICHNAGLAVISCVFGVLFPSIYIRKKKEKRLLILNTQLGDALMVMANALRSGFGFQQAMDAVRQEMPPPIAAEFSWTIREMNLGFSQEEALKNMASRVQSEDLDMVVTGILIQRQVGGNLALVLENISETIRDRARIKKEINVLTAQGRMSGMIIGLIPLILIAAMLVISPDYFNIMIEKRIGIILLAAGGMLELMGILAVKKIIDIEY